MRQEDIQEVRAIVREELARLQTELPALMTELTTQLRDIQAEIRWTLEALRSANSARLALFGTPTSDETNDRIRALEERILYLENRRHLQ